MAGPIRSATEADLDAVVRTYDAARAFMRAHGNTVQWVGGYPGRGSAERDLQNGWLWVLDDADGVSAVMSVMPGPDRTYASIEGRPWLNNEPYWVMHRLATARQGRGLGTRMLEWLCARHDNVRADTHESNAAMQAALEGRGFVRCGTIICDDGTPRVAYHFVRPARP